MHWNGGDQLAVRRPSRHQAVTAAPSLLFEPSAFQGPDHVSATELWQLEAHPLGSTEQHHFGTNRIWKSLNSAIAAAR